MKKSSTQDPLPPHSVPTLPDTLTFNEVLEMTGLSRTTIDNRVKEGILRKYKKKYGATRIFFKKEDVLKLVQAMNELVEE